MKNKAQQRFDAVQLSSTQGFKRRSGFSRRAVLIAAIASLAFSALPIFAARLDVGGKRSFSCYTANAYVGADLSAVIALDPADPNYLSNLVFTATTLYGQVVMSDPPARLAGIADEIVAARPDVVSVVEMYTLSIAPATSQGPGTFSITFDFLSLLTRALAEQGAHYEVAVVSPESDVMMPIMDLRNGTLAYGRLTDHEAILVRTDLPPGYLKVSNPQTGQFVHHLQFPSIGLSLYRGWCSVDVFCRGERMRYITTHLEEETVPAIQMAQGLEVLAGPAQTELPVVLVGDFNADPLHRNGTFTYDAFSQAGFRDAWAVLNPTTPEGGLTWGHDPLLSDPTTAHIWRIDLILYRGELFSPTDTVVLDPRLSATTPPLWPSDHAALAASFLLGNRK
jgi:hypothetical protein